MIKPMLRLVMLSLFMWGTSALRAGRHRRAKGQPYRSGAAVQRADSQARAAATRSHRRAARKARAIERAKFAPQLRQLAAQERDIRFQLRQEMMAGNSANQQHVSDLLDARDSHAAAAPRHCGGGTERARGVPDSGSACALHRSTGAVWKAGAGAVGAGRQAETRLGPAPASDRATSVAIKSARERASNFVGLSIERSRALFLPSCLGCLISPST